MRIKRKAGQAMVEFALVLPILILLLCGIIDFGWIFGNQIVVNNATREAARYTAIHYGDFATDGDAATNALGIVKNKAQNLSSPTINTTPIKSGEEITISIQGTIPVLTPFTSIFLSENYTVKAESVMRIE